MGRGRQHAFSAFGSLPQDVKDALRLSAPVQAGTAVVTTTVRPASARARKRLAPDVDEEPALDAALFLPTQRSMKRQRVDDAETDESASEPPAGTATERDRPAAGAAATDAQKSQVAPLHSDKSALPNDPLASATFYTSAEQVPRHLKKYFAQRHRLFSRYDDGCLLDAEGWYSVTPEAIADRIAERCACAVILDAFCGVGGNAIAFARTCHRVIALDNCAARLAMARHNATLYGVADRIEFVLADFPSFARSARAGSVDAVFLSPPWGGPAYLDAPDADAESGLQGPYALARTRPLPGPALFAHARCLARDVAFFLPRNADVREIGALVPPAERVEIEEQWMGSKLKALTCYFGGLVAGQE